MVASIAFISHAAEEAAVADELCRFLEQKGIGCWIAPRDVAPGSDYASEIVDGIERCCCPDTPIGRPLCGASSSAR